ncbi:MAG TPA: glyoxalase superfamily protein [Planktothrix sp.]|jgi:uncharacterized glyoxalase superfamily protein PhnB
MRLGKATPVLRMFNVDKAREFYIDYLGYKVDWEHRFESKLPLYMQISRDDSVIHLSEHHGDGAPGQHLRVAVEDIDAFYAELKAKNYNYMRPGLETQEWGERSVTVCDPFCNKVIYWQAIEK